MGRLYRKLGVALFLPTVLWGAGISYSVDFEGLDDTETLKALRSSSQLLLLRKKQPPSLNALRFRAESDVPELVHILHAYGYLEAEADYRIEENQDYYHVIVSISPGPLYCIEEYKILWETETPTTYPSFSLTDFDLEIGDPAQTKIILDSELAILRILAENGYPLAAIKKRDIIANGNSKLVKICLTLDAGPLAYFGPTCIEGNTSVSPYFIGQQIQWHSNDIYNSCLVEMTQKTLMDTGLFCSVFITHPKSLSEECLLPIKIEVTEAKHKTVSLGASYQTTYGPGATFGWENRNVGGLGRHFTLQIDIAQRTHSGIASYLIPNFYKKNQNYTFTAQAAHEAISPYHMQTYNVLNRFDKLEGCLFFSIGAKLEYMRVNSSVHNGNFFLIEAPLFLRYTNVTDFLNPPSGFRFEYRAEPAVNFGDGTHFYYSQILTFCSYIPLWDEEFFILAQKLTLGTIFSDGIGAVPVPKRLFGGSEDNLRGYKYYTVSPLKHHKPTGGRSAIFYSLEPRFRISKSFGFVPFFDMGNVYKHSLPTFEGKWRKSVGIGLRHYSFIGPLRLDFAFPLNRREGIDPHWWVFVSLGQTF